MSRVVTLDGEPVQFVLNDLEDINAESLSDIIYSDGTRAILVNGNGQILHSDTQTVVLQDEDFNQYYINDENGEILVADDQDVAVTQSLEDTDVVQFIDEDGSAVGQPQIIYVNEEGYAIDDSDLSQYQIAEGDDTEATLTSKTIKLETQVVDLEELLRQQGESQTIIDDSGDANGYQYAILKDGKLHIQSYSGEVLPVEATDLFQERDDDVQEQDDDAQEPTDGQDFDLSMITGRNLLTGQTVSLHGYMDKLQKKINDTKTRGPETGHRRRAIGASAGLKGLLNKKLTLGKTSSGKRLVGKVIHVEKKKKKKSRSVAPLVGNVEDIDNDSLFTEERDEDMLGFSVAEEAEVTPLPDAGDSTDDAGEKSPLNKKKVVVQEKLVSKECLGHICRTLSGLMSMDTVRRKLQGKSIVVKVVERRYDEACGGYSKRVSYSGGHMQEEFVVNDEGEMLENWSFVLDDNIMSSILGMGMEEHDQEGGGQQYPETTNVTIVITYERNNHRAIRVILNPTGHVRCLECDAEFGTSLQLRVHVLNTHSRERRGAGACEVCNLRFASHEDLREHRDTHVEEGKLFRCPKTDCGKFFLTARRLQRHASVHAPSARRLECSVCMRRCSSDSGLKRHLTMAHLSAKHFSCDTCGKGFNNPGDLNFHRRVHGPQKYYVCKICKRTFSRHSNLLRHIEIHKGSEELYQCTVCGCSYHYMSSLTRHVVQNHIKRSDVEAQAVLIQNVDEEA